MKDLKVRHSLRDACDEAGVHAHHPIPTFTGVSLSSFPVSLFGFQKSVLHCPF